MFKIKMAGKEESDSELYCICRQPYNDEEFMIECNVCKDWFHGRLVAQSASNVAIFLWAWFIKIIMPRPKRLSIMTLVVMVVILSTFGAYRT